FPSTRIAESASTATDPPPAQWRPASVWPGRSSSEPARTRPRSRRPRPSGVGATSCLLESEIPYYRRTLLSNHPPREPPMPGANAATTTSAPSSSPGRQLRYAVAMSLDGFIAGPAGEYDWITMDPDIDFGAIFKRYDAFVMGRKTYQVSGAGMM